MMAYSFGKLLAIDPGVEFGYAKYDNAGPAQPVLLTECGIVVPPARCEWMERTHVAAVRMGNLIHDLQSGSNNLIVVCEWPKHFESEGGRASEVRGDFAKLMFVVGRFAQVAAFYGARFVPLDVNEWKGQMSKEAVAHRVAKRFGGSLPLCAKSHAIDAIGIGLYYLGVF